jgi:hypothetical protein
MCRRAIQVPTQQQAFIDRYWYASHCLNSDQSEQMILESR